MTEALPANLRHAVLVSGNPGKAVEARRIVGAELETVALDLPEIQSLDLEEVLLAKAEEAWHRLGRPLVVDETGLELSALGGFPGPLVKWMLKAIGAAGIAHTALALGDPGVTARCALMYFDGERSVVGRGTVEGTLVPPRGDGGFGWDPIFLPQGETLTYAELSASRKDRIGHRGHAWRALVRKLREPEGGAST
ncbi:MAG: non-canonical purine NTP pyrophosphatase [Acidobacteria bacterium]|nr:non-canonical purine NTP pyrophosphatase [Acidobacteriota bacterium]